jgi:hypothetical protein
VAPDLVFREQAFNQGRHGARRAALHAPRFGERHSPELGDRFLSGFAEPDGFVRHGSGPDLGIQAPAAAVNRKLLQ